ncbi:glycosyltransferase [Patulibacter sp.]|uniref:CgeB family protein n=1 Tax=Patulibacter sp. TaxID=1912859 RepID=UPI00272238E4|nr:glycosyltransferase [Patulibacter sp.]MDO9410772.1 glycosyltransferase [Patulibacter sp.]
MRIAYVGQLSPGSNALARAEALRRVGHDVVAIDTTRMFPQGRWPERIYWRTGYRGISKVIGARLIAALREARVESLDLVWISHGPEIDRSVLDYCRSEGVPSIAYNVDDPFGNRDGRRWATFLRACNAYDAMIVVREPTVADAVDHGVQRVLRVFRGFDEVVHAPRILPPDVTARYQARVSFIGSWEMGRGEFIERLLQRGVPISVWGNRWQRAPEWSAISKAWRGPGVYGRDYSDAIQCAEIAIGLLSAANRDLHTQRSLEIPALGTVLCAQRTEDHSILFDDGKEGLFWTDADECADLCLGLLADDERRRRIARAGQERVRAMYTRHEAIADAVVRFAVGDAKDIVVGAFDPVTGLIRSEAP